MTTGITKLWKVALQSSSLWVIPNNRVEIGDQEVEGSKPAIAKISIESFILYFLCILSFRLAVWIIGTSSLREMLTKKETISSLIQIVYMESNLLSYPKIVTLT